jgi:glyoxylase-like metal-dependent hydrolase (beta-lactamase superfamily II)
MEVTELATGLWRWTGYHEEWKKEVGSVCLETEEEIVLIDPLIPSEDRDTFLRALDRDVQRGAKPVHVLITVYYHARSSRELAERYGARLWARTAAKRRIKNRAGEPTDVFEAGDPLPGGVQAFDAGDRAEVVYWLPEHRAIVAGDVLLGEPELRLCPKSWLGKGTTHDDLKAALRPLLELPVERVLVSHGPPVLEDAGAALADVLR